MLGTLNGALEVRGIQLDPDSIDAKGRGINEIVGKLPVLTSIHIVYRLRIPAGSRETVDRALERHQSRCPTAATLAKSVAITWEADIEEVTD
jgi:uncharacterized OsmC-like protein